MGRRELWIALETNDKVVAKNRACAIYSLTNKLFSRLKIVSNELAQNANDTVRDIIDERFKPLFDTIISTYEVELSNLKSQYQVMNAEHLLVRLEQDDAFLKFAGDANAEVSKIHQLMKDIPDLDIKEKNVRYLGAFQ